MSRPFLLAVWLILGAACKPDCKLGDPTQAIELQMVVKNSPSGFVSLEEGAHVSFLTAPQGGYVLFVGPRATNLDGCGLQLEAVLRDECDDSAVTLESRPVDLDKQPDGFGTPKDPQNLANYANLSVCPNAGLGRDLIGGTYLLKLRLTDKSGRTAEKSLHVIPTCAEGDMGCQCECSLAFTHGTGCSDPYDAGPPVCTSDGGGTDSGVADR